MKCHEISELLVAYLHDEVTRSERTLIQAHLRDCETCQYELAMVAALQDRVRDSLQRVSAPVTPSGQSWSRLRDGLAEANRRAQANPIRRAQITLVRAARSTQLAYARLFGSRGLLAPTLMVLLVVFGAVVLLPARWGERSPVTLTNTPPVVSTEVELRAPVPFSPEDLNAAPASATVLRIATDPYNLMITRPCAVCLIPR